MQVQMIDRLPTFIAHVSNNPIAFSESFGARDFCRDSKQVAEKGLVLLSCLANRREVFPRHYEHMDGGPGIDVAKGVG